MNTVEILEHAASRAEQARTLDKAVRAGWSALHTNRSLIDVVFRAWADHEGVNDQPSGLGALLRRRYATPADIAASLRATAETVRGEQP